MNENLKKFLERQTCASICCIDENGYPYCFSCYYSFNAENGLLHFKSSADAKHSKILSGNPLVAGTILPDKLSKLHIMGVQFEGDLLNNGNPLVFNAASIYYKKHPVAMAIPGVIWTIRLSSIKFTDSRFGFGEKINWRRVESVVVKNE